MKNRAQGQGARGKHQRVLVTLRAIRAIGVIALTGFASACGKAEKPALEASAARADSAHPSPVTPRPSNQVLFAGTSLTAGLGLDPDSAYPMLIQRKIDSAGMHFEVVNAGESGETSAALLQRLGWLLRGDFSAIVIETGANDGLRGISVAAMRKNVEEIVRRVQSARPSARVLLVQMEAPPNLGTEYTTAFHSVFPDVAKATGVTLLPFLLDDVAGRRELNQSDGIHPNMKGERIVAENVWKGLEPVLRGLVP
jgi:acyl-CoA thioesterase I